MNLIVAYTDGACKGNPGITGYGSHVIKMTDEIKPKQILSKWISTDKGYQPKALAKQQDVNQLGIDKIIDIYGYTNSNTNNQAELDAVIEFLKLLTTNEVIKIYLGEYDKILIKSDSMYVLNTIDKILNNDSKLPELANQSYLVNLEKYINLIGKDLIITSKVLGHSGQLGNDRADMLANMGVIRKMRNLSDQQVVVKTMNEYWKLDFNKHPLVDSKLMFDYTMYKSDKNTYYMINYKDESDLGKRDKDVVYDILITEEDLADLKNVSKLMAELTDTTIKPYVIKLPEIYHKEIHKNLELYNTDYLIMSDRIIDRIDTIDGIRIANEIYPPSLSYLALEINSILENKLLDYVNNNTKANKVDITDRIYENIGNKNKLKPDIKNDKYSIKINTDMYNFRLFLNLDLPKRNLLKRIEKMNPKIELLYEHIENMIRYYIIISITNDNKKSYLLKSNYYVNLVPKTKKK